MNNLLIHTNTFPEKIYKEFESIGNRVNIRLDFENIDSSITETIIDALEENYNFELKLNAIFIQINLSENYSELLGPRIAAHFRLNDLLENLQTPIFLIGPDTVYDLLKINELGSIVLTPNIFIQYDLSIQEFKNNIEKAKVINQNCENEESFKFKFLKHYKIAPDKSHHSIINEWAIYQWSQLLNVYYNEIDKVKFDLNFNYLKLKHSVEKIKDKDKFKIALKVIDLNSFDSKVVLIDNDVKNGWGDIFSKLYEKIDVSIGSDFKTLSEKDIEDLVIEKVKIFKPEIVILDLRLSENDLNKDKLEDYTGYKCLMKIKEYNTGIQVIIFSATNKIWNLNKLLKVGANGFIQKSNIDRDYIFVKDIENAIFQLKESISLNWLVKFDKNFRSLPKLIFENHSNIKSFFEIFINVIKDEIKFNFKSSNLKFTLYANLVFILENFVRKLINEDKSIRKDSNSKISFLTYNEDENKFYSYLKLNDDKKYKTYLMSEDIGVTEKLYDLNFKLSSILIYLYGVENLLDIKFNIEPLSINESLSIKNILLKRNRIFHEGSFVEVNDIQQLLYLLLFLFDKNNYNPNKYKKYTF
jgi:hypothetical protein